MREEIAGTGVTLSTVMPGPVRTRLSDGIPLQGVFAIEPDQVARAIVESCRTRAGEIAVPGFLAAYPVIESLVPEALVRLARRAVGAGRVLTHTDASVRADYEAALRAQVG